MVIPPFTPGTFDPVNVTFTRINPNLAVDFTLRAANSFHAIFIDVRCPQTCTPATTVTEGDLFPGGLDSFGVSSGPGSVTVDSVNAGTGLQSLTVVSATNAIVVIPPFTPGTFDPVTVTFTRVDPNLALDFTLRAANTFHSIFIRVRCEAACTPSTVVTEGDLFPGGLTSFGVSSGPESVIIDHVNGGTGLQSLTVVGTPTNATVTIPAFTPGTFDPTTVTFTRTDPNQSVDFTLRAASTFHSIFIRVRCVCTRSQGYYKNHPDDWPVQSLTLGTVAYTQTQLLAILGRPVKGNGLISLAKQLIAAKLNAAAGAYVPPSVVTAIADADALIGIRVVPPVGVGVLATSSTGSLTAILDQYNNGNSLGGPPHCE